MNEDNMSAEQAPQHNADQREPQTNKLQLATAGASAGQNPSISPENDFLSPSQYDARLGGTDAAQPPFTPGAPGSAPEKQPGTGGGNFGGIKGRVAAGVLALLGLAGAGGAAYEVSQQGGDDNSDKGVVLNIDTPTAKASPTVEAKPTTEPKKVEKSPYNFDFELKVGDTTFRLEENMRTRKKCPDPTQPPSNAAMVECSGIEALIWDKEKYPNLGDDFKAAEQRAFYFAWKSQSESRVNVSFDEYLQKLSNKEDLSFNLPGFQGDGTLPTNITVFPTDKVIPEYIPLPASLFYPNTSKGISYRKINDEIHIEQYIYLPPLLVRQKPAVNAELRNNVINNYLSALTFMSASEILKKGSITSEEGKNYFGIFSEIEGNLANELDAIQIEYNN